MHNFRSADPVHAFTLPGVGCWPCQKEHAKHPQEEEIKYTQTMGRRVKVRAVMPKLQEKLNSQSVEEHLSLVFRGYVDISLYTEGFLMTLFILSSSEYLDMSERG